MRLKVNKKQVVKRFLDGVGIRKNKRLGRIKELAIILLLGMLLGRKGLQVVDRGKYTGVGTDSVVKCGDFRVFIEAKNWKKYRVTKNHYLDEILRRFIDMGFRKGVDVGIVFVSGQVSKRILKMALDDGIIIVPDSYLKSLSDIRRWIRHNVKVLKGILQKHLGTKIGVVYEPVWACEGVDAYLLWYDLEKWRLWRFPIRFGEVKGNG